MSYQHDDASRRGAYAPVDAGAATPINSHVGPQSNRKWWLAGAALAALAGAALLGASSPASSSGEGLRASAEVGAAAAADDVAGAALNDDGSVRLFDEHKRFVVEDYDARPTFASFLPGVAGYFGTPVWAFYVNRGQALATFGIESKDFPLLEFNAADKAYQLTSLVGFRTFVRGTRHGTKGGRGESFDVEPFGSASARNLDDDDDDAAKPKRLLFTGPNEVEIQDANAATGLTTNVAYFVLPEEAFPALVRRTTLRNTAETAVTLEVLDGLAKMEPSGGRIEGQLKSMSRTLEGWFNVLHADHEKATMPFYKLSTETTDDARVVVVEKGNYCLSFLEGAEGGERSALLPVVYDKDKVFGKSSSLERPSGLDASSVGEILDNPQFGQAKTSSAFAAIRSVTLQPGESITIASVYGRADHLRQVPEIAATVTAPGYVAAKFLDARRITNDMSVGVDTNTTNPLFDATVRQMFLDNSLRGGLPTIVGHVDNDRNADEDRGVKVFHTFSRIHGDLERDYNAFHIDPGYFSNGPGNFRDVAQNRRNDVTFFPRIGGFDVRQFLSFIQADGYEPLTVEAPVYVFDDPDEAAAIAAEVTTDATSARILGEVLSGGAFRPGQLFDLTDQLKISRIGDDALFVNTILAAAQDHSRALFGEGYWGDHWDYYLDLVDAYLAVFPDGEEELMYDRRLRYFFSTATVRPRATKYVLDYTFDGKGQHVLQLASTYFDTDKAQEQEDFRSETTGLLGIEASWQRTQDGDTFLSSPIAKLFLLGSLKFATRDAWGMGVEYEGGNPGWLDSMNGLPGMVGSGMPETYELLLLLRYVKKVADAYDRPLVVPAELGIMITAVEAALDALTAAPDAEEAPLPRDVPPARFDYWDAVATAREEYRATVEFYFSGATASYPAQTVSAMLTRWIAEIEAGIERAHAFGTLGDGDDGTSGVPACYFSYDVTEWEKTGERNAVGLPLVNAKAMKVGVFPIFLEGPVRYMKTIQDDKAKMTDMYGLVRDSVLRDEQLDMYYVSASLTGVPFTVGRQTAFTPGWLENQSIWLHMSYKYYLQLLRGGLYEQFFAEYRGGGLLPFMDPEAYGRPVTECSSFIASSAFPDPAVRRRGFLARLSGSTAEFMDIYQLMFYGPNMFYLNGEGAVEFRLRPALPTWLFVDEENAGDALVDAEGQYVVSFKLFGAVLVTYHNPDGGNLYGAAPTRYEVGMKDGSVREVAGDFVPSELALKIRRTTEVASIDAYF